jgi:hypothetical protein
MMVFVSNQLNQCVLWADESIPEGPTASGFGEGECWTNSFLGFLSTMTVFGGELDATDHYGSIISTNIKLEQHVCTVRMVKAIAGPPLNISRSIGST